MALITVPSITSPLVDIFIDELLLISRIEWDNHEVKSHGVNVIVIKLLSLSDPNPGPLLLKISDMGTDSICRNLLITTTGKMTSWATNSGLKVPVSSL